MYSANFLLLCVSFQVALVAPLQKKYIKFPDAAIKNGLEIEKKCRGETVFYEYSFRNLLAWNWENKSEELASKFSYCFLYNIQFIEKDGHIAVDNIVGMVAGEDKQELEAKIKECNQFTGKDRFDTMNKVVDCFLTTQPIHFAMD